MATVAKCVAIIWCLGQNKQWVLKTCPPFSPASFLSHTVLSQCRQSSIIYPRTLDWWRLLQHFCRWDSHPDKQKNNEWVKQLQTNRNMSNLPALSLNSSFISINCLLFTAGSWSFVDAEWLWHIRIRNNFQLAINRNLIQQFTFFTKKQNLRKHTLLYENES